MRCTTCGTDNAPDSRFCGGCGARLGGSIPPSAPRVAPTQKISDDAPMPVPTGAAPMPYASPASIPPQNMPIAAPYVEPISISNGTPSPLAGYGSRPSSPTSRPDGVSAFGPTAGRGSAPSFAAGPAPRASASRRVDPPTPSLSMPVRARRPWTLIFVVLALDLALAGTGGWLLSQGLASSSPTSGAK